MILPSEKDRKIIIINHNTSSDVRYKMETIDGISNGIFKNFYFKNCLRKHHYLINTFSEGEGIVYGYKEHKQLYIMSEREMFEKSFQRPKNYFKLSSERQWEIDKDLGILDWMGDDLTDDDKKRFKEHYD